MLNAQFDEFMDHLVMLSADPAQIGRLKSYPGFHDLCRRVCAEDSRREPDPLPPVGRMNAVQVALFDNWRGDKPVKSYPNRYTAAIEVWTKPANMIKVFKKGDYDHKVTATLCAKRELLKQIERAANPKNKRPITARFVDDLMSLASDMTDDQRIGMLTSKPADGGTMYHDGQAILVDFAEPGDPRATLLIGDDAKRLPGFSTMQSDDSPLRGNVAFQARADFCGFSTDWKTN